MRACVFVCLRESDLYKIKRVRQREKMCECEREERDKEKCDSTQINGLGAKSETVHTTASNNLLQYLM